MSTELNLHTTLSVAQTGSAAVAAATASAGVAKDKSAAPSSRPVAPVAKPFEPTINVDQQRQATRDAIAKLNEHMNKTNSDLNFSMDNVVNTPVITVKRSSTGEVVRQIPNEVVIRVAHDIENLKGVLYSEKI